MEISSFFLAKRVKISGIVQGVGFRPFVYKMAKQYGLVGEVSNSTFGVDLVIEGSEEVLNKFIDDLIEKVPSIARIDNILADEVPLTGFDAFSIIASKQSSGHASIVSPDISICTDCLDEIRDSSNRRYRYPFINCTNCGPRYTIVRDIPYDRHGTSMSSFTMCASCQKEYSDPNNRRFHAQPNACSVCGPSLWLTDSKGSRIDSEDPIVVASGLIKKGYIIAIKGLGGFHLAVDATNELAVRRLRNRKQRKDKPFALMSVNVERICSYAQVSQNEEDLLTGIQRPIVLLKKRADNFLIAESVSPNNRFLGVMLPYTPLHYLIFAGDFLALVMTSGNLTGESMSITNEDALKCLGGVADYFILHNRNIITRSDDSILKEYGGDLRVIRRARGYVPLPIEIKSRKSSVLACGAELKSTICFTRGNNAFVSQHIGDLKTRSAYDFFRATVDHMQHILMVNPEIIVCDYHPDYMSTRYALERQKMGIIQVQHHHAHIAACMAENHIKGPVIGLAFDGTGLGNDGTIWGGEVLIADYASFERVAGLELVPMPGGFMAIREPWRMGISYLYNAFGQSLWNLPIPFLRSIDPNNIQALLVMISKKINVPYTSSLGRFFDGIAAILGIRNKVTFEGQAAIELEAEVIDNIGERYDFDLTNGKDLKLIISPIVRGVVTDISDNISLNVIAAKFHNTIVFMFLKICLLLRKEHHINRVALSGGVFQNVSLLSGLKNDLENNNFEVFMHRIIPFNDGGISFGQAAVALHLI